MSRILSRARTSTATPTVHEHPVYYQHAPLRPLSPPSTSHSATMRQGAPRYNTAHPQEPRSGRLVNNGLLTPGGNSGLLGHYGAWRRSDPRYTGGAPRRLVPRDYAGLGADARAQGRGVACSTRGGSTLTAPAPPLPLQPGVCNDNQRHKQRCYRLCCRCYCCCKSPSLMKRDREGGGGG